MKHMTWNVDWDKSWWPDGPWQEEPDKEQWIDEETGYTCLIVRNKSGAWCGYVGISEGHPWHGKNFGDVLNAEGELPDVHGGLTYSDYCMEGPESETICHVPEPGDPEPLYWLGFDCSHANDFEPLFYARSINVGGTLASLTEDLARGEVYRDREYVKNECARLARQAREVE